MIIKRLLKDYLKKEKEYSDDKIHEIIKNVKLFVSYDTETNFSRLKKFLKNKDINSLIIASGKKHLKRSQKCLKDCNIIEKNNSNKSKTKNTIIVGKFKFISNEMHGC